MKFSVHPLFGWPYRLVETEDGRRFVTTTRFTMTWTAPDGLRIDTDPPRWTTTDRCERCGRGDLREEPPFRSWDEVIESGLLLPEERFALVDGRLTYTKPEEEIRWPENP